MIPGPQYLVETALIAALLALLLGYAALHYARRRALVDLPGRRRSHSIPTPRGGGIGIVLAMLAAALAFQQLGWLPPEISGGFAAGLAIVALVGWIDDHKPLPATARLVVHVLASAWFVAQLPQHGPAWFVLQTLTLVAAINIWNFMDGIDGLAVTQSGFVAAALAVLLVAAGAWVAALLAVALLGACLGFLPLNFPRARIFLGDVGSGGLGFACAALMLIAVEHEALAWWSIPVLASGLGIDAACTLCSRMLRGRRWYTAHREHLYQWRVRSGRTHAQTTSLYLLWNLVIVVPMLWLAARQPNLSPMMTGMVLVIGAVAWWLGKREALARVRSGGMD